jgi:hypothetical protein
MHGACGAIDTASTLKLSKTSKSEIHMKNGDAIKKKI